MLRCLTLALVTALPLAALPMAARADCPAPGEMAKKLTYNSGAVVEVIGRKDDRLIYRQTIEETGKTVVMTVQVGIYTISAIRDGEGAVFDWKTPLPAAADLVPGATFDAEAILTTPGFLPPRPFTAKVQVLGEEEVTVAGCTFTAMKVVVDNAEGGKPLGTNTKWMHMPSLVTLKSEIQDQGQVRGQEVVAFE